MKKIILFLSMLVYGLSANAQQVVTVERVTGEPIVLKSWEIKRIYFSELEKLENKGVATMVDLGLPSGLKWASFNVGATRPMEVGYSFGWGDTTGKVNSDDLSYYPCETPTGNIVATEFDIAKSYWSDLWRMPTSGEFQELIDNCTWETVSEEDSVGIVVTGVNGNHIFLPVDVNNTKYWSGSLSTVSTDNASALDITSSEASARGMLTDALRSSAFMVRPVYGDYKFGITLESTIDNVTSTTADLHVLANGDIQDIKGYGVFYSQSRDNVLNHTAEKYTPEVDPHGNIVFQFKELKANKTYYCLPFVVTESDSIFNDRVLDFTTLIEYPIAECVDLGLSVKWSSWNMGATNETEEGGVYGWGDPTGKLRTTNITLFPIAQNIGGTQYDMATEQWGAGWRLPTKEEIHELANLKWSWSVLSNGVKGYKVTNTDNGNSIFLPVAGVYAFDNDGSLKDISTPVPYMWSSESDGTEYTAIAYEMKPGSSLYERRFNKYYLLSIRPVYDETLVKPEIIERELTEEGRTFEEVDLGLSVKWASRNLGQDSENPYGKYYAWGEIQTKETYSPKTYTMVKDTVIYKDGAFVDTTAYNIDYYSIAATEYDAAYMNLGGTWHMPSIAEFLELKEKCDWELTLRDGIKGYVIRSREPGNNNSIFLPAGGEIVDSRIYSKDEEGYYWTDERFTAIKENAFLYHFNTEETKYRSNNRAYGQLIRPVKK